MRRARAARLPVRAARSPLWSALAAQGALGNEFVMPPPSRVLDHARVLLDNGTLADAGRSPRCAGCSRVRLALRGGRRARDADRPRARGALALRPVISFLFPAPKVALYPAMLIVFGLGSASKVAFGFSEALFPVLLATAAGTSQVEPRLAVVGGRARAPRGGRRWSASWSPPRCPASSRRPHRAGGRDHRRLPGRDDRRRDGLGHMMAVAYQTLDTPGMYVAVIAISLPATCSPWLPARPRTAARVERRGGVEVWFATWSDDGRDVRMMRDDSSPRHRGLGPHEVLQGGRAVDGVDLSVRSGSVYGVLGPNGAGKTTTIRMLATLLRPDGGTARVMGHDVVEEADAVRGLVSLTGQLASVDEDLTGRENLILLGRLLGLKRAGRQGARRRTARGLRPRRGVRAAREELLGRHAAAARHRRQPRRHAGADVPRRADHGAGPAVAQPGVGDHPLAGRGRDDDPAVHPVPRGGRPARRRDRRHRPRPRHRRGHAEPAQGVGRHRGAARAAARPRAAARGRAHPLRAARRHPSRTRPDGAVGVVPGSRARRRRAGQARPRGRAGRRVLARAAEPRRGLSRPHRPHRRRPDRRCAQEEEPA